MKIDDEHQLESKGDSLYFPYDPIHIAFPSAGAVRMDPSDPSWRAAVAGYRPTRLQQSGT